MVLTLASMNNPAFVWTQWQSTLIYWAIMTLSVLVNRYSATLLPKLEYFFLALHILGFFAFLIPLVVVSTSPVLTRWTFVTDSEIDGSEESDLERGLDGVQQWRQLAHAGFISLRWPHW